MTSVKNVHFIFIINFTFTSTARFGVFLSLLYYRARNVDRSACCKTRYKLKLTHRFSRRGKHYAIGMLLHRSNSRSSIKMIVVDPGESLTCISIYAAHSSSCHWPWQNHIGNTIIEWTATEYFSLYSIVHCFLFQY